MTAKKRVGARIIEGLTEFTEALESGAPLERVLTGHTVKLDLKPGRYTPHQVRAIRRLIGASQFVFAEYIGVAVATVRAWEQGTNRPSGAAARLMDEIRSDPAHWRARLRAAAFPHARGRDTKSKRTLRRPVAKPARLADSG
jgi:putative transcriptional regulator